MPHRDLSPERLAALAQRRLELSLWDALRFSDRCEWTYRQLSEAMGCCVRNVERFRPQILATLQRWDALAVLERDGGAMVFRFDVRRVRRGLERVMMEDVA